jgi:hypothetical protein
VRRNANRVPPRDPRIGAEDRVSCAAPRPRSNPMTSLDSGSTSKNRPTGTSRAPRTRQAWLDETWKPSLTEFPERRKSFATTVRARARNRSTAARPTAAFPGEYPYTRGVRPTMYRGRCGPCGSTRASPARATPTSASACCSQAARPGSRRPSTCRRRSATTPTIRSRARGRPGRRADQLARDMERCSTRSRSARSRRR